MDLKSFLLAPDPVEDLWKLVNRGDVRELEPALAALKMEIPKGFHHKDNLGHTVRVLERAIEREPNGPDLLLRTAAVLHDIGKPATREFGKPGVVTFRNHEAVGAKQSRKLLKTHGYSSAEREQIERLVFLHMRAYGFGDVAWTDSAVRRLATDAGSEETLDRLIVIFYSDLTTTKLHHRRKVEDGIAKLEDALARVRAKDERAALRPSIDGYAVMERTGLKPGRELGAIMKFLQTDEAIALPEAEAWAAVEARFPEAFKP